MKTNLDVDFKKVYLDWLKENMEQYKVDDTTFRLTVPFFDRDNDFIEIYVIDNLDGTYLVTDDGATIRGLELGGFDFSSSEKRKMILNSILRAHGVLKADDGSLLINSTTNDLPLKKHMLTQCMLKVNDMFYLSRHNIQSVFLEDVKNYLDANKVRYIENINITGKSTLLSNYDFVIARSDKAVERFIKVINNMDSNAAKNVIFSWGDIKDVRQGPAKLYTIIQDKDKKVNGDSLKALERYGIIPALWSEKEQYISELTA